MDFLSAYSSSGKNPAGLYWNGTGYSYDSFGANVVETYVGAGVPGAFEGDSPFGECIKLVGQQIFDGIPSSMNHISQKYLGIKIKEENSGAKHPICEQIGKQLKDENKISKDLTHQYFLWINNTNDVQPGSGISGLDAAKIIYGDLNVYPMSHSDSVVPIEDEMAIYNNLIANNKYINETGISHTKMTEERKIFNAIMGVIMR